VQHFLDIGQKNFGVPITCQLCQLLYVADDEEDVRRHRKYCEQKNRPPIVSFKTLLDRDKPLYVSDQDTDEVTRIINVPETAVKVMHELRTRVFPQVQDDLQTSSTFFEKEGDRCWHNYIAVRNNGEVIGLLILEDVPHQSVRFISDIQELSIVDNDHIKRRRVDPSSSVGNSPSWVGVHAIWVHRSYRRQGWAARLLDSGRAAYCFGQVIDKRQLAFSQPTTAGWALASRYLSPGSPCNTESRPLGTDSVKSIDGDSQENRSTPILEIPCYV
jgi:GNAT superfamily N-acetyltransferase